MSTALKYVPAQYRETVTGSLGAGAGLFVSEVASEYTTRLLGYTSYGKALGKTVVKVAIGTIVLALSRKTVDPAWKLMGQMASIAGMGSSLLDWFAAYYPGGVVGLANTFAMSARVVSTGSRTVSQTFQRVEVPRIIASAPSASSSRGIGKY